MNTPDPHPIVPWLTPQRRAWIYRATLAVLPLLVLYGVAAEAEVALWAGVIAAFLSTGTAALHTPTSTTNDDHGHSLVIVALVAAVVCLVMLLAFDLIG